MSASPDFRPAGVLACILDTYDRLAKKGDAYGGGRTLPIQANRKSAEAANGAPATLIRVSALRDAIPDECPFEHFFVEEAVLTQYCDRMGHACGPLG